jgi:hypothetical protein
MQITLGAWWGTSPLLPPCNHERQDDPTGLKRRQSVCQASSCVTTRL